MQLFRLWSFVTRRIHCAVPVLSLSLAGASSCGGGPTADGGPGGVRERWHQAQPGFGRARPAVAGGLVYFGTGDGQVIARDVATGAARWAARVGTDPVKGANFVTRDGVVAVALVHYTVGLDATTGRELWRYAAPADLEPASSVGAPGQVVLSHLDADDQAVYVPAWGASVSAVDLRTGAVRWVWQPGPAPTDTARRGRFRSGAAGVRVSGDTVFATVWHFTVENGVTSEGWLVALDRGTGRELWRAVLPNARGGAMIGAPALAGSRVLMNTTEVRVYALDRATGKLAWEFKAPESAMTPTCQVEAYGDVVYVDGGDSFLYALNAGNGAVRWRSPFRTAAAEDLLVTERRVALPNGAFLFVFDRATGRQLAETTQPRVPGVDALFASPAAYADGRMFVTLNGAAWSFDEP